MKTENTTLIEDFEGAAVPVGWSTGNDGLAEISTRHAKDGKHSLRWQWENASTLIREELALSPAQHPQTGMEGWVYLEKPLSGRLELRLGTVAALAVGAPGYIFRFGLNFTGWRMFRVVFDRDCKLENSLTDDTPSMIIEALEIAPPPETPAGGVWLDALAIGSGISSQRSADFQVPEHEKNMGNWCAHWPLHYSRQSPSVPLPVEITAAQQEAFELISRRYCKWILGDDPDLSKPLLADGTKQLQSYIQRGWKELEALNVVRDAGDRIVTPGLVKDFGNPCSFKHVLYDILMPIVLDYKINGNEAAGRMALDLFDYIYDQGWAEGHGLGDLWLNCLGFAPYCHALFLMRDELKASGQLDAAIRAASWFLTFGKSFSRFDEAYIESNADALRSIVYSSLVMILAMDDSPTKVQFMSGWLDWFNDALRISPRFVGLIKPDGLGFHHQGVYASAYSTEAYEFCSLIAWLLHGTEFAAASELVANLKLALATQDAISNKYDVPYTTMGRMPGQGCRILSAYAYLALAGQVPSHNLAHLETSDSSAETRDGGETMDADLAGIFMRLWDPEEPYLKGFLNIDLNADGGKFIFIQTLGRLQIMQEFADRKLPASPSPQGFWSKPWGALAIHRRDNWLVSVKGWSQYVWNFEMHPKASGMAEENVFARYWSYGTLQPITHGNPANPVDSGWNLSAGWDWCRWPGSTTPHLTPEELYDPASTWANRFFSAASFVGGVRCEGRNGLFALKLHEHYYDPTFRAFKTYFFFDNEIICLGSNIETRDAAHTTATTLFQCWMPDTGMPVQVNGEVVTEFPYEFAGGAGEPLTLMDPYGNGYVVPDSRDVRLTRSEQKSRDAWNRGETSGGFSTCWFDHGAPPRDDGYGSERYHYVMLVQTTQEALEAYAKAAPCRVLLQNHQAHILEHSGQKTMAYALFETDWIIPHGIVRKTDTPVMVMVMVKESGAQVILSLADPDLRLPKRRNMGYLDEEANATPSRPSTVRMELRGDWRSAAATPGVVVEECRSGITAILFTCREGARVEVILQQEEK